jgi:ribonucleotide reductase alpha subunit
MQKSKHPKQIMKSVVKRDGNIQPFDRDKLYRSVFGLCHGLDDKIDAEVIVNKLCREVCDGINTSEISSLASEAAASYSIQHPDFSLLAARIELSHLHKHTPETFSESMRQLWYQRNKTNQVHDAPIISRCVFELSTLYAEVLDNAIDHDRDEHFDYFAIKTMQKSYLLKVNGVVAERPQYMFMRVALAIHLEDINSVIATYAMLSKHYCVHATPTLANAGTVWPQLSSCFLAPIKDDSIDGIYDTLKSCAIISNHTGGIGLSISNIRASGAYGNGTSGGSQGVIPLLRVFNNSARYTSYVSVSKSLLTSMAHLYVLTMSCLICRPKLTKSSDGRRTGLAVYLEPWHADIFEFIDLRKNHGNEDERTRDIYTGLWVPDLFMKRVRCDDHWTLMCPLECPGLDSCWGAEFDRLYTSYEQKGMGRTRINARELWFAILSSQAETGTPYMMYKDHCNSKSNQSNLGTIKCSNLCTEIIQYSSLDETAVCNLGSINLRKFVDEGGNFDFDELRRVSGALAKNLNIIIERTRYPVPEARVSNERHRPIGIGVQGLANVFQMMGIPYDSDLARKL